MAPALLLVLSALAAAPSLSSAACVAPVDFLASADALAAPVRPEHCARLTQTPPAFTWPAPRDARAYEVQLTFPDGHVERRATAHNWLLWNATLPAGAYQWRVSVDGGPASGERRFAIAEGAIPFVVPDGQSAVAHARATPRPRTWPHGEASPFKALRFERMRGFVQLRQSADRYLGSPLPPEPASSSIGANYDDAVAEEKRTVNAAFAWFGTLDERYRADAIRRLMAMSAWHTTGALAPATNDMANRAVARTLALGYDWMADVLDERQRATLKAAIRARTQPMVDDVVAHIPREPYDSHREVTLATVAAIAALMAGDLPEADDWLRATLPLVAIWTSAWGGADGGYANGTMQMLWDDAEELVPWYILRNAAGLDLAQKEWVRHHVRFLLQFLPPGTPSGVFGDGVEEKPEELQARVAQAFAAFAPDPVSRWYASRLPDADLARLELLIAPTLKLGEPAFPRDTPRSAYFPSVGWAAFHADLTQPGATSVYFKSSPYGSHNHSHADQNSFVVSARGRRLAIASGYYDGYDTPHWKDWYKQTRAANAITFDGGKGQGVSGKQFAGTITRFESRPGYDYAVGHAEAAYAGALTLAQRTLVYLRPDTIVVYDRLAAPAEHTWEWNIHALNRMAVIDESRIAIENAGATLCVQLLAGPPTQFRQDDAFPAAPRGNRPNQWHGTFATRGKSTAAEFIALLRVGADCRAADPAVARRAGEGWDVDLRDRHVRLDGDRVRVR